jgi:hypothetical protein
MADYSVILKDKSGHEICSDIVSGLPAAKERAKYLISDKHAILIGSSHQDLETDKAEVRSIHKDECLWDIFR